MPQDLGILVHKQRGSMLSKILLFFPEIGKETSVCS